MTEMLVSWGVVFAGTLVLVFAEILVCEDEKVGEVAKAAAGSDNK